MTEDELYQKLKIGKLCDKCNLNYYLQKEEKIFLNAGSLQESYWIPYMCQQCTDKEEYERKYWNMSYAKRKLVDFGIIKIK